MADTRTAVTAVSMTALDTLYEYVKTAATADTDGGDETFKITPTGARGLIVIGGTGSSADGNITYSINAGDLWAGKAKTGTVTKNKTYFIEVDTAAVLQSDGTIEVNLDPAATDKLKSDHAAYVGFIELI